MPSYQHVANEQTTYAILQNVGYIEERRYSDYNCELNDSTSGDSVISDLNMENNPMYLEIVEQPTNTFRYRYKSEKGSHGGIKGENSSPSKKSFPTVRVQNCPPSLRKKIVVKVSLYIDPSQPHVYELTGKSSIGLKLDENYMAVFKSLTIAPRKKEEVIEFLKQRKKANYDFNRISYTKSSLEAEAQEEMKSLNLDCACLCFEAFSTDDINAPLCAKVFSNPVNNQKSAATGDLRIVRLSSFAGKCSGGETVILLCEKIKKEDVKVRFFEQEKACIADTCYRSWQVDAKIVDIHHQLAIVFETPAYQTTVTKEVSIELFRPSDERRSEAVVFRYIPDEREIPEVPRKRKRLSSVECDENLMNSSAMDSPVSADDECSVGSILPTDEFLSSLDDLSSFDLMKMDGWADAYVLPVKNENPVLNDYSQLFNLLSDATNGQVNFGNNEKIHAQGDHSKLSALFGVETVQLNRADFVQPDSMHEISNSMNSLSLDSHRPKIQKASNDFSAGIKRIMENRNEKTCFHYASHLIPLQDEDGNSLLHLAIMEEGSNLNFVMKMVQMVTAHEVNHQNRRKETPLHVAVKGNHEKIVFLLLARGGDPNLVDSDGNSCLHLAAKYGHLNCLKLLMPPAGNGRKWKHDVQDIDLLNNDGMSALHLAVTKEFEDCVNFLLSSEADVNLAEKKSGRTALHLAIEHPSLLKAILKQPLVDVNIQDFGGYTAIQLACMKTKKCCDVSDDKDEIVEFLLNLNLEEECSETESDGEFTDSSEFEDAVECFEPADSSGCTAGSNPVPTSHNGKPPTLLEVERELCIYLDKDNNWTKLADLIGLDTKHVALFDEGLSPSMTVLRKIKEMYPSSPLQSVVGSLELAGLEEGVRILQTNP